MTLTMDDEIVDAARTTDRSEPIVVTDAREMERLSFLVDHYGYEKPRVRAFLELPYKDQVRLQYRLADYIEANQEASLKRSLSTDGIIRPLTKWEKSWAHGQAISRAEQRIIAMRDIDNQPMIVEPAPGSVTIEKHSMHKQAEMLKHYASKKGLKIQYQTIGEYGGQRERPHYHQMIFFDQRETGVWYDQKKLCEVALDLVKSTWRKPDGTPKGFVTAAPISMERAAYICQYNGRKLSKFNHCFGMESLKAKRVDGAAPEFRNQSRRLGWDEAIRIADLATRDKEIIESLTEDQRQLLYQATADDSSKGVLAKVAKNKQLAENPRLAKEAYASAERVIELMTGRTTISAPTRGNPLAKKSFKLPYRLRTLMLERRGYGKTEIKAISEMNRLIATREYDSMTPEEQKAYDDQELKEIQEMDLKFEQGEKERGKESLYT